MTGYTEQEVLTIHRQDYASGPVVLPGSKSIANRAILLASLSGGETLIKNVPLADDVQVLLRALPSLGVGVTQTPEGVSIQGSGGAYGVNEASLNLENAGTALRPMVALLSASSGSFVVDGNEQMRKRPIHDLVESLRNIGIEAETAHGYPPVRIRSSGLPGGTLRLSGKVSSQFVSALLLAAPLAKAECVIELSDEPVSKPYIDLTVHMMSLFGVELEREGYRSFRVTPQSYVSPGIFTVEGDATAATYFFAAAALPGSGPVHVHGISFSSTQGDIRFLDVLKEMGADVGLADEFVTVVGPALTGMKRLRAVDIDMGDMPDAAMTLAVLALYCDGETHIRNIANLRVKESERIQGLRTELEKLGATVREEHDALHITPPERLREATIETYHDHRMAMAFSLAAFGTDVHIVNPGCVKKTFPTFFESFLALLKMRH